MDEVIELEAPWIPDPGSAYPRLFAEESNPTLVVYRTAWIARSGGEFAALRFPACQIVRFGYPNDEALPGHPLYPKGLRYYGIFEVLDSSWSRTLDEQNLVSFPNPRPSGDHGRHFVVTFHDSTLECIAESLEGRFASSFDDAVQGNADATFTSV